MLGAFRRRRLCLQQVKGFGEIADSILKGVDVMGCVGGLSIVIDRLLDPSCLFVVKGKLGRVARGLLQRLSHTPVEVDALTRLQQAHDWVDIGRTFVPAPERCFTWWSYRSPDWTKNDRGRRLDHMWVSPDASHRVLSHRVLEPCRSWERPSDHVPLICEVAV